MTSLHRSREGLASRIQRDLQITSSDVISVIAFVTLLSARDPEGQLPNAHIKELVKAAYIKLHSQPSTDGSTTAAAAPRLTAPTPSGPTLLNDMQLDALLGDILASQPGGAKVQAAFKAAQVQTDMSHWSFPRIKECLQCKNPNLQLQRAKEQPYFYAPFQPGEPGRVYMRHCPHCNITYQSDGFQKSDEMHNSNPDKSLKLAYPANLAPKDWIHTSSATVVSQELINIQRITVHALHGSSQATCSINTFMALTAEQLTKAGAYMHMQANWGNGGITLLHTNQLMLACASAAGFNSLSILTCTSCMASYCEAQHKEPTPLTFHACKLLGYAFIICCIKPPPQLCIRAALTNASKTMLLMSTFFFGIHATSLQMLV